MDLALQIVGTLGAAAWLGAGLNKLGPVFGQAGHNEIAGYAPYWAKVWKVNGNPDGLRIWIGVHQVTGSVCYLLGTYCSDADAWVNSNWVLSPGPLALVGQLLLIAIGVGAMLTHILGSIPGLLPPTILTSLVAVPFAVTCMQAASVSALAVSVAPTLGYLKAILVLFLLLKLVPANVDRQRTALAAE